MSSFEPEAPSDPAPWGSWSLDYQFLSDLNSWTAKNPAKNTLRVVLQPICDAIEGSKPYVALIPNYPFPAQTLVTALGALIQFGVKVAHAKQEVRKFAQDTVEWITRIADAFRDGEVGRFVAKSWNNLQSMRLLIDEICAWAAKRLADGHWKRLLRGAVVDQEIRQFKEDLARTTECFKTLSTIHLAQGQDLVLRNMSIMHSLIEGLRRENEANQVANRDNWLAQAEALRNKEMREQAEGEARREEEKIALAELRAREQAERHRRDLDDAFGPIIAENSTFAAQTKEFCYGTTRCEILQEIRIWALDLAESSPRFLWLSGMPGSGKSVITATVARMFDEEQVLGAQFFISGTQAYEPTTNPNTLFPTIAKQLYGFHIDALLSIHRAVKGHRSILLHISDAQANGLFVNPITAICRSNPSTPVVIVIDALDEWNTNYLREVNPTDILLNAIRQLPSNAKVLISSRHEDPIISSFSRFNPHPIDLATSSPTSLRDVGTYIKDKLGDTVREFGEDWAGWPTESQVQGLCQQAAGHFIWAATATKFIRFRIRADGTECKEEILDDLRLGGVCVDGLYSAILNRCIPDTDPSWNFERFRRIVGALLVLRSPLNIATFGDLLDLKKTPTGHRVDMKHFFKIFQSVLSVGPEVITPQSVPRLHGSFVHYIVEQASQQFRIDKKAANKELASRCIALLKGLDFNICDIPSSHCTVDPRAEIPAISAELAYACQIWADHLTAADPTAVQDVLSDVQIMLENKFLYWLEVMSVTGKVSGALTMLRKIATRMPIMPPKLRSFIREASQFVVAFHEPIARSAPHIYISALPFLRADSQIYQAFAPLFPSTLGCTNSVNRRIHPLLRFDTPDRVTCMAFSNHGTYIATASSAGKLHIWDSRTGEPLSGIVTAHKGSITCASFSPLKGRITTGGEDRTLCVTDIETGKVVLSLRKAHVRQINTLAYSPDGRYIVSGGADSKVRVWDAETGDAIGKPLKGQASSGSTCVAFSPGSIHFASCTDKEIFMWKVGFPKLTMRIPRPNREGIFTALAFSADGEHIFAGINGEIWAWELLGSPVYGPLQCPTLPNSSTINSIMFHRSGKCMVSSLYRGAIVIWDPLAGEVITGPLEGHTNAIDSSVFSPDGQYLASASSNKVVRVWDIAERIVADCALPEQIAKVQCVALSPDETHAASGSDDALVRIWDCRKSGNAVLHELEGHTGAVDSVAFSSDGEQLISCSRHDSAIRIWNVKGGELACAPCKIDGSPLAVGFPPGPVGNTDVAFHYVQASVSAQRGQEVDSLITGIARLAEDTNPYTRHSSNTDDSSISDSSLAPQKQFWKSISKAPVTRRSTIYLSENGGSIVSCLDKRTIQLTSTLKNSRPRILPAEGVTSVAVAPDGQHLVWGSDRKIFVWNAAGRAPLSPLLGHVDEVTAVAFSPDGRRIVSASLDKTIRIRTWTAGSHWEDGDYGENFAFSSDPAHSFPKYDPLYGRGPRTAKRYRRCFLDEAGWIKGEGDELLFWVPPENRAGLWLPDTLAIVGAQPTTLDLSRFVHGESWTECHTRRRRQ